LVLADVVPPVAALDDAAPCTTLPPAPEDVVAKSSSLPLPPHAPAPATVTRERTATAAARARMVFLLRADGRWFRGRKQRAPRACAYFRAASQRKDPRTLKGPGAGLVIRKHSMALRGFSLLPAALVALVGCNAIFGITSGQPAGGA